MSEIEFNYDGTIINIQCNTDEKFLEIINRFLAKVSKKKEDLYFMYSGGMINEDLTFNEQANESDKERNIMSIVVNERMDDEDEEESIKKSKYIICPECGGCCLIKIVDYNIELFDCKNGHKKYNISIPNFENTQNYDESKIKCQICNNANKNNSYNNLCYICLGLQKKFMPNMQLKAR